MKINPIVTPAPKTMPIANKPKAIPIMTKKNNIENDYSKSKGLGNKIDIKG